MQDLATIPETWLEDILGCLDFFQQCQRRRTCRRWNRLLTGSRILGTMIYPRCIEGQENRCPSLWDAYDVELSGRRSAVNAFKNAATFLHTLILTEGRHKSCKNAGYCKWWGDAVVQGVDLLHCLDENPVDFPRRLVLANMRNVYMSHPSMYLASWGMVFKRTILKNVAFDRETLPHVMQDMIDAEYYQKKSEYGVKYCLCTCAIPIFNTPELQITIPGEYVLEFSAPAGMDFPFYRIHRTFYLSLWKLFVDQMEPLTAEQIDRVKGYLTASQDKPLLVECVREILKRFHSNCHADAGLAIDLSNLELTSLSPPLQCLLFSLQAVEYEMFPCWIHPAEETDQPAATSN